VSDKFEEEAEKVWDEWTSSDEWRPDSNDNVVIGMIAAALRAAYAKGLERAAEIAEEYGAKFGNENKDQWTITHTMAGVNISMLIKQETKGLK